MTVSRTALKEYLDKPLDSFTWIKQLPRDQLLDEFRGWRVKPRFKTDPWTHQLACFYIGMCYPQFLMLLDMGLGKSKILLDILTQRIRERKTRRAIITVPRLINLGSWEDAVAEHSDLGCTIVSAENKDAKFEALLKPEGEITIVDYSGLQYALSKKGKGTKNGNDVSKMVPDDKLVRMLAKEYDFFGMDESHKAKNRDTLRWKVLHKLTQEMPARFAMTGTLFGRDPTDLFAQFQLIDGGETFGDTLGMFRAAFFQEVSNGFGIDYKFDRSMTRALYKRLQHRSIRYDEDECGDLPERREIRIKSPFTDDQREHYLRAVDGLISANGQLRETDSAYLRMRQIVAGFIQWTDEYGKHEVTFPINHKLDQLERLVEEAGASKVVVSHEYTRSGELITQRLASLGIKYEWLHGGSKDPVNAVRRFVADPECRVFVMNSDSGGTGVDGLQKVARYLIFYESPVSPITRKQALKRVHRPGQRHACVIYDLVVAGSVDIRILRMIEEGKDLHASIVDGTFDIRQLRLL